MELYLQYFLEYETWIYVGLGVIALWQIRKFALAWDELRGALFGMERERARGRLNGAATMLVFLLVIGVIEFSVVTFVIPSVPGAIPLPSPTLDLLATPTITLQPAVAQTAPATTPIPGGGEAGTAMPGCVPDQVNLTSPQNDSDVSGMVTLEGTANIPNFGFYTYEIARPGETIWLPLQVGQQPVIAGTLGTWDVSSLIPGEYQLRLVVTDGAGNALPPCVILVRVTAP